MDQGDRPRRRAAGDQRARAPARRRRCRWPASSGSARRCPGCRSRRTPRAGSARPRPAPRPPCRPSTGRPAAGWPRCCPSWRPAPGGRARRSCRTATFSPVSGQNCWIVCPPCTFWGFGRRGSSWTNRRRRSASGRWRSGRTGSGQSVARESPSGVLTLEVRTSVKDRIQRGSGRPRRGCDRTSPGRGWQSGLGDGAGVRPYCHGARAPGSWWGRRSRRCTSVPLRVRGSRPSGPAGRVRLAARRPWRR